MDATAIQLYLAGLLDVPDNATPDEATPDVATPDEGIFDEATFDEATPKKDKPDLFNKNGDVDYDGVVSIMDATKIQMYLASIIPEL
jgi:hypothetical protein